MGEPLGLLGIAKKAGLLAIGFEPVSTAVRTKKARVIMSASDASDSSKRRARGLSEGMVFVALPYTKFELGRIIGRGTPGILAIIDIGIAAKFVAGLAGSDPESYGAAAELLDMKNKKAASRKREKNTGNKRRTAQ